MAGYRKKIGNHYFLKEEDYKAALQDQKQINELRSKINFHDIDQVSKLYSALQSGRITMNSVLGRDFDDEIYSCYQRLRAVGIKKDAENRIRESNQQRRAVSREQKAVNSHTSVGRGRMTSEQSVNQSRSKRETTGSPEEHQIEAEVKKILRRRETIRRVLMISCSVVAVCCLTYFGIYSYMTYRTGKAFSDLADLKAQSSDALPDMTVTIKDEDSEINLTVLDEYKTLYNKNKSLIGWIKIDDTDIDYPVMQSSDAEYYLTHNFYQEYDKNGCIFLDPDCDVVHRSNNLIIYGHHMKSGKMFGSLDQYSSESFYEEHKQIRFDTIYEKGTYEVMYVFRSRIYNEDEITFKYYQFINADSELEFYSNMDEMAAMSLYDTGISAVYGDQLLTLSTCDYQETNGRFVVVAKRIS